MDPGGPTTPPSATRIAGPPGDRSPPAVEPGAGIDRDQRLAHANPRPRAAHPLCDAGGLHLRHLWVPFCRFAQRRAEPRRRTGSGNGWTHPGLDLALLLEYLAGLDRGQFGSEEHL